MTGLPRTALFRCDASLSIGGGHVMRCLALASAMRRAGWCVRFATTDESVRIVPDLRDFPGEHLSGLAGNDGDIARLRAEIADVDLLVIDGYGFDAAYEAALRELACTVLAIDDEPNRPHAADVILDQTLGRRAEEYDGLVPAKALRLCGSRYALLRSAFPERRNRGLAPVAERERLRALVSFGLTDSGNATGLVLRALAHLDLEADIVIGDHAPHRAEIAAMVSERAGWRLLGELDQTRMAEHLAEADIAIGAPGSSSYERCCLGRPAWLLLVAENQRPNARALEREGAAALLGDLDSLEQEPAGLDDLARRIEILADRPALRAMGERALRITDGLGADRVIAALERALAECFDR